MVKTHGGKILMGKLFGKYPVQNQLQILYPVQNQLQILELTFQNSALRKLLHRKQNLTRCLRVALEGDRDGGSQGSQGSQGVTE